MADRKENCPKGSVICDVCQVPVSLGSLSSHRAGKKHLKLAGARKVLEKRSEVTIHVSRLPPSASALELTDYFSKFGSVARVVRQQKLTYAFVEFTQPVKDLGIFEKKHHLQGREINVNPGKFVGKAKQQMSYPAAAVDISRSPDIIENIPDSSLETQVKAFLDLVCLPEEEILKRREFVAEFSFAMQKYIPGSYFEIFGSTANGLGFKYCDTDISLFLAIERDESQIVELENKEAPRPKDVEEGKFPQEELLYLSKRNLLFFVYKCIQTIPGFKGVRFIPSFRCPIIKFQHSIANVSGDVSFNKGLGVANTRLLRLYGLMDFRIYVLLMVLRFWGKREQFIGSQHLITSYAFSWLVIFYLQRKQLVPTVETLASFAGHKIELENWDCTFSENLDVLPINLRNEDIPLSDLVAGFFEFYVKFDFTLFVICPRDGSCARKNELIETAGEELDFKISSMSVQDAFDLTHNITGSVNDRIIETFLSKCTEQHYIWKSMKGRENLKCLFNPTTTQRGSETINSDKLSISLPLKSETSGTTYEVDQVSNFVLEILKRAFLFDCKIVNTTSDMKIDKSCTVKLREDKPTKKLKTSNSKDRYLFHVLCSVGQKTWIGRKNIKGFVLAGGIAPQLANEESIAREAAKLNPTPPGTVLHVFEITFSICPDNASLRIKFTPKTTKNELMFTVIPFVKKYIVKLVQEDLESYILSKQR